ncbi:hypothetical protein V5O48_001905 [Marasmius crinis-equi]|uniref:Uncharacterized protein n=1 Tax=Marasmius crinis-equi TaxID=585013 RepID=A0ABR3FXS1_9AGAR
MDSSSKISFLTSILHGTAPDVNDDCFFPCPDSNHDVAFLHLQTLLNVNGSVVDVNGVRSPERGCTVVISAWRPEGGEADVGHNQGEIEYSHVDVKGRPSRTRSLEEHALDVFQLFRKFDKYSYSQLTRFFLSRFHKELHKRLHSWDSKFKLTPLEQLRLPPEYFSDLPPTSHRLPKVSAARLKHHGLVPASNSLRTFKLDSSTAPLWIRCIARVVTEIRNLLSEDISDVDLDTVNSDLGLLTTLLHIEATRQLLERDFPESIYRAQMLSEPNDFETGKYSLFVRCPFPLIRRLIDRLKGAEKLWHFLHDIAAWHIAIFCIKTSVPMKFLQSATAIILWNPSEGERPGIQLLLKKWIKQFVIDKLSNCDKEKRRDALAWVMRRANVYRRAHIHPGGGLLALAMSSDVTGVEVGAGIGVFTGHSIVDRLVLLDVLEAVESTCTRRERSLIPESAETDSEIRHVLAWAPPRPGPTASLPEPVLERIADELQGQVIDHALAYAETLAIQKSFWRTPKAMDYAVKIKKIAEDVGAKSLLANSLDQSCGHQ